MYNALKQSLLVPAIDKLLNTIVTNETVNAAKMAVRGEWVYKFKCSIILSPPHDLLPAEWVAVFGYNAGLTQFDYRHFYYFMKPEKEVFALPLYW